MMLSNRNGVGKAGLLLLSILGSLGSLCGATSARAEPAAKCVRDTLVTTLKIFACKYFVNTYAQRDNNPELSIGDFHIMDEKRMNDRVFGNETEPRLCGSINYSFPSENNESTVEDSATGVHAQNALRFARVLFDSFNVSSNVVELEAKRIARIFYKNANVASFPVSPSLETEVSRLDKVFRDGIVSIEATQKAKVDLDRCAVISGAFKASLPVVVGPNLTALAKRREASSDYAIFSAALEKSPHVNPSTRSP